MRAGAPGESRSMNILVDSSVKSRKNPVFHSSASQYCWLIYATDASARVVAVKTELELSRGHYPQRSRWLAARGIGAYVGGGCLGFSKSCETHPNLAGNSVGSSRRSEGRRDAQGPESYRGNWCSSFGLGSIERRETVTSADVNRFPPRDVGANFTAQGASIQPLPGSHTILSGALHYCQSRLQSPPPGAVDLIPFNPQQHQLEYTPSRGNHARHIKSTPSTKGSR